MLGKSIKSAVLKTLSCKLNTGHWIYSTDVITTRIISLKFQEKTSYKVAGIVEKEYSEAV